MSNPPVLIVGAGAMGLVVGYHLSLAGADVTYLVRPGRSAAFAPPQQLYCYDDASVKTFARYTVVEQVSDLAEKPFQFVIVTLDGHTIRTPEATAMLRGLGDAIHESDAAVIVGVFGVGLREHYLEALRVPEDRLLSGFLYLLSHQSRANLPVHAPTDPALVAQANVCYKHPANKIGFQVVTRNSTYADRFVALYNRCGVSRCGRMHPMLIDTVGGAVFAVYAACELAGWPGKFSAVVANRELWRLACRAQCEIIALPRHGWPGKLMAMIMGPRVTAYMHLKMEREALPLDHQAFTHFHHGGKVRAQDIAILRDCLADGQVHGQPMKALTELLAKVDTYESANQGGKAR